MIIIMYRVCKHLIHVFFFIVIMNAIKVGHILIWGPTPCTYADW